MTFALVGERPVEVVDPSDRRRTAPAHHRLGDREDERLGEAGRQPAGDVLRVGRQLRAAADRGYSLGDLKFLARASSSSIFLSYFSFFERSVRFVRWWNSARFPRGIWRIFRAEFRMEFYRLGYAHLLTSLLGRRPTGLLYALTLTISVTPLVKQHFLRHQRTHGAGDNCVGGLRIDHRLEDLDDRRLRHHTLIHLGGLYTCRRSKGG